MIPNLSVIGLLHHSSKPSTSYKRKIFLYDKGDFDSYRQQLTDVDWETLFGHNDVDTIVANPIKMNCVQLHM
jgi:hypothetical protein